MAVILQENIPLFFRSANERFLWPT